MIATQTELSEFHRFALQRLSDGMSVSLQDLLDEWNAAREFERSVEKIGESMRQYDAGECLPLEVAVAQIRSTLERRE